MRRIYFDSSAIVKLSHAEPFSQDLIDYIESGSIEAVTSVFAETEVLLALRRAGADAGEAMHGFYLLAFDEEVRREAAKIGSRSLRAIDAIHLATALAVGDRDIEFLTYDQRQAQAAHEAGLKVVQPGR